MKTLLFTLFFFVGSHGFAFDLNAEKGAFLKKVENKISSLQNSKKSSPFKSKLEKQIAKLKGTKKCASDANNKASLDKCKKGFDADALKNKMKKKIKGLGF